jgi:hypothetical protein
MRETRKPDCYGVWVNTATQPQKEPYTVKEALNCTEKEHWEAAMQKEMDSIYSNDVWDLVELPANRNGCSRRKPTLMVQLRDLKLG